jgi:hypothetical protein
MRDRVHGVDDRLFCANVGFIAAHLDAVLQALCTGPLKIGGILIEQREIRTALRKLEGKAAPNAAARTCDDDGFRLYLHVIGSLQLGMHGREMALTAAAHPACDCEAPDLRFVFLVVRFRVTFFGFLRLWHTEC